MKESAKQYILQSNLKLFRIIETLTVCIKINYRQYHPWIIFKQHLTGLIKLLSVNIEIEM